MTKKPTYKRRILLINPQFQLSFLGYSAGIAVVVILIFFISNMYFFSKFEALGKSWGLNDGHAFYVFLSDQKRAMSMIFGLTSIVALAVICLGGLILSHRVAGPLYRLKMHLKDLKEGRSVGDVKFRDKDYFKELAQVFNEYFKNQGGGKK